MLAAGLGGVAGSAQSRGRCVAGPAAAPSRMLSFVAAEAAIRAVVVQCLRHPSLRKGQVYDTEEELLQLTSLHDTNMLLPV